MNLDVLDKTQTVQIKQYNTRLHVMTGAWILCGFFYPEVGRRIWSDLALSWSYKRGLHEQNMVDMPLGVSCSSIPANRMGDCGAVGILVVACEAL